MNLLLDWCSYKAAKYAVEHWHYSKRMPFGKTVMVGVWEDKKYIGCVLFGYSANPNVAKNFNVRQQLICELTRVALANHSIPTSRIVAIAIKLLRKHCPKIRVIVSFADADENHFGTLYQAGNWLYLGKSMEGDKNGYIVNGKFLHCRSAGNKGKNTLAWVKSYLDTNATEHITRGKYKYAMPFDSAMRKQLEPFRQPYPKRVGSIDSDVPVVQAGKGGANPTSTLTGGKRTKLRMTKAE